MKLSNSHNHNRMESSARAGDLSSTPMPQAASMSPSDENPPSSKGPSGSSTITAAKLDSGSDAKPPFTIKISLGRTTGANDRMINDYNSTKQKDLSKDETSNKKEDDDADDEHNERMDDASNTIEDDSAPSSKTNTTASIGESQSSSNIADQCQFSSIADSATNTATRGEEKYEMGVETSSIADDLGSQQGNNTHTANTASYSKEIAEEGSTSNYNSKTTTVPLASPHLASRSSSSIANGIITSRESISANIKTTGISTSITASFLDSISEEQRRVRTRHLPGAAGFRKLHKSEIKRDMALVKAMLVQASKGRRGSSGMKRRDGSSTVGGSAVCNETAEPRKEDGKVKEKMDVEDGGSSSKHEGGASEGESTPSEEEVVTAPVSLGGKFRSSTVKLAGVNENRVKPLPSEFILPLPNTSFLCVDVDDKPILSSTPNNNTNQSSADNERKCDSSLGKRPFKVFPSPHVVDSMTAFNPPRPPESIGPKKMHRLCRWERNPHAVEIDMNTYRKTVERTRQELCKAELERERIEMLGCHLRDHFLNQFKLIKEENECLNSALSEIQLECVKGAGLLTCKTRSKGGSVHAMRDVISVLKSRGEKVSFENVDENMQREDESGEGENFPDVTVGPWHLSGVGGICSEPGNLSLANGWFLPGDRVGTPLGGGIILKVFGPRVLDVTASCGIEGMVTTRSRNNSYRQNTCATPDAQHFHGFGVKKNMATSTKTGVSEKLPQSMKVTPLQLKCQQRQDLAVTLPPHVCVRLPFGIGYFVPNSLTVIENSSMRSDAQLASRWMKMLETAKMMGTSLDITTMENYVANRQAASFVPDNKLLNSIEGDCFQDEEDNLTESSPLPNEKSSNDRHNDNAIDVEGDAMDTSCPGCENDVKPINTDHNEEELEVDHFDNSNNANQNNGGKEKMIDCHNLFNFACGTFPSPSHPGGTLDLFSIDQLERNIDLILSRRGGLVGKPSNPSIPKGYRQWESKRQESRILEGKVLQLRNEVRRQRRFRHLNERSCAIGKERRDRFEVLLVEMKADLNSLKERLYEELIELGINQEKAEELLIDCSEQEEGGFDDIMLHDLPTKRRKEQCEGKSMRQKLESATGTHINTQL